MDFEDNNPFGLSDEDVPRPRIGSTPSYGSASAGQRIVISEAGKSREGSSRGHITYTIRLASGNTVRRRYSDFESLRKLLRRLFPCIVVPPIPEKHALSAYAANPAHAHEDARVIEHRQRTLGDFLNRCVAIPAIHDSWVLERFLDPNTSWREVLQSDLVTKLPRSPLQAPPVDPTKVTPAHAFLPIPSGGASLRSTKDKVASKIQNHAAKATALTNKASKAAGSSKASANKRASSLSPSRSNNSDPQQHQHSDSASPVLPSSSDSESDEESFEASELMAKEYEYVIGSGLEKRARRVNKHYSTLASEYAELGGQFNSFSLDSQGQFERFAPAVEKVGQAVDQGYISTARLVEQLGVEFTEPLAESVQLAVTARQVLKYRRQRELQVHILNDALKREEAQLAVLLDAEAEAERMNAYLHADDRIMNATKGLNIGIKNETAKETEPYMHDRDHVVDKLGDFDRDHEISPESFESALNVEPDGDTDSVLDVNSDVDESQETNGNDRARESEEFDDAKDEDSETESLIPTVSKDSLPAPAPKKATGNGSNSGAAPVRRGFKLPGLSHLNHAIHGMMDVDPQTTRRNNITRSKERIQELKAGLEVAKVDAEIAAQAVSAEIARYNNTKHDDIRAVVKAFVRCHIEWAEKNLESWTDAKQAIIDS